MTCEHAREALAAHVLGTLTPAEAAQVRDHLHRCPSCAAENERNGALVSLLAMVPVEAYGDSGVGEAGLTRLLNRIAAEHRRQRRLRVVVGLAVAAAVAVVAAGVGAVVAGSRDGGPAVAATATASPAPDAVFTGRVAATGVWASVSETDKAWGTAVRLELGGVPGGQRCRLVAETSDGRREVAATWAVPRGGYDPEAGLVVDGAVGLTSVNVDRYVVETLAGVELVGLAR